MVAKPQKAADTAEIEIGRLHDELCKSSDREREIRATTHKVVQELQEQLQAETFAHQ